jgi:hypothetical protein
MKAATGTAAFLVQSVLYVILKNKSLRYARSAELMNLLYPCFLLL